LLAEAKEEGHVTTQEMHVSGDGCEWSDNKTTHRPLRRTANDAADSSNESRE